MRARKTEQRPSWAKLHDDGERDRVHRACTAAGELVYGVLSVFGGQLLLVVYREMSQPVGHL